MQDFDLSKYNSYKLNELQQVLRDIDREKYPDRASIVEKEICSRLGFRSYEEYKDFMMHGFRPILSNINSMHEHIELSSNWKIYFAKNLIPNIIIAMCISYLLLAIITRPSRFIFNESLIYMFLIAVVIAIIISMNYYKKNKNNYIELKDNKIYYNKKDLMYTYNLEDIRNIKFWKRGFAEIIKIKFENDELELGNMIPNYKIMKSKLLEYLKIKIKNYDLL